MASGQIQILRGDREVFKLLLMLRVMTIDQIRRTRYFDARRESCSAEDNVRKRLKRLWDAGYLNGHDVYCEDAGDVRLRVYSLGQRSLPHLQRDLPRLQQSSVSASAPLRTIDHSLMVSEFGCRLLESARQPGVSLVDLEPLGLPMYHSRVVEAARRAPHTERFVTQEEAVESGTTHHIRPDLVFAVSAGEKVMLYLLEADRGFEQHANIAAKLRAYYVYRSSSAKRWRRYDRRIADMRVVLVTTTTKRIAELRESLVGVPGFELMAMTTIEAAQLRSPYDSRRPNLLLDPIWTIPSGNVRPLVE